MKPNICFDFDGVIHSYVSGWICEEIIPDKPVLGIREELIRLFPEYEIIILTARSRKPSGHRAVIEWMNKHRIPYDLVTDRIVPANVYVSARGIRFDGQSEGLYEQIKTMQPWTKKQFQNLSRKEQCDDEYGEWYGFNKIP